MDLYNVTYIDIICNIYNTIIANKKQLCKTYYIYAKIKWVESSSSQSQELKWNEPNQENSRSSSTW